MTNGNGPSAGARRAADVVAGFFRGAYYAVGISVAFIGLIVYVARQEGRISELEKATGSPDGLTLSQHLLATNLHFKEVDTFITALQLASKQQGDKLIEIGINQQNVLRDIAANAAKMDQITRQSTENGNEISRTTKGIDELIQLLRQHDERFAPRPRGERGSNEQQNQQSQNRP